jgi:hypothetical protein
MSGGEPELTALRLEFAGIAGSYGTVQERAAEILQQLGRFVAFDAGWLTVRDPERQRHGGPLHWPWVFGRAKPWDSSGLTSILPRDDWSSDGHSSGHAGHTAAEVHVAGGRGPVHTDATCTTSPPRPSRGQADESSVSRLRSSSCCASTAPSRNRNATMRDSSGRKADGSSPRRRASPSTTGPTSSTGRTFFGRPGFATSGCTMLDTRPRPFCCCSECLNGQQWTSWGGPTARWRSGTSMSPRPSGPTSPSGSAPCCGRRMRPQVRPEATGLRREVQRECHRCWSQQRKRRDSNPRTLSGLSLSR